MKIGREEISRLVSNSVCKKLKGNLKRMRKLGMQSCLMMIGKNQARSSLMGERKRKSRRNCLGEA